MPSKKEDRERPTSKEKKKYVKPELKRMNEKIPVVSGQAPVSGPPVSAHISPVAPGSKVF